MTTATNSPQHAFYFRRPSEKGWTLVGVYDSPENAWRAALDHHGSGDIWFPQLPPDEPSSSELTSAEACRFKALRLVTV